MIAFCGSLGFQSLNRQFTLAARKEPVTILHGAKCRVTRVAKFAGPDADKAALRQAVPHPLKVKHPKVRAISKSTPQVPQDTPRPGPVSQHRAIQEFICRSGIMGANILLGAPTKGGDDEAEGAARPQDTHRLGQRAAHVVGRQVLEDVAAVDAVGRPTRHRQARHHVAKLGAGRKQSPKHAGDDGTSQKVPL